jgi:hypothetical protein
MRHIEPSTTFGEFVQPLPEDARALVDVLLVGHQSGHGVHGCVFLAIFRVGLIVSVCEEAVLAGIWMLPSFIPSTLGELAARSVDDFEGGWIADGVPIRCDSHDGSFVLAVELDVEMLELAAVHF